MFVRYGSETKRNITEYTDEMKESHNTVVRRLT